MHIMIMDTLIAENISRVYKNMDENSTIFLIKALLNTLLHCEFISIIKSLDPRITNTAASDIIYLFVFR